MLVDSRPGLTDYPSLATYIRRSRLGHLRTIEVRGPRKNHGGI